MNTELSQYLKKVIDRIPPADDIMMRYPLKDLRQDLDFLHGDKFPEMLAHARVDVSVLVRMAIFQNSLLHSLMDNIGILDTKVSDDMRVAYGEYIENVLPKEDK